MTEAEFSILVATAKIMLGVRDAERDWIREAEKQAHEPQTQVDAEAEAGEQAQAEEGS